MASRAAAGPSTVRLTDCAADRQPQRVRVIEYTLPGVPDGELIYRLVTTLLDPATAPAAELAALYHERWEVEGAFDELKTHLKGELAPR